MGLEMLWNVARIKQGQIWLDQLIKPKDRSQAAKEIDFLSMWRVFIYQIFNLCCENHINYSDVQLTDKSEKHKVRNLIYDSWN